MLASPVLCTQMGSWPLPTAIPGISTQPSHCPQISWIPPPLLPWACSLPRTGPGPRASHSQLLAPCPAHPGISRAALGWGPHPLRPVRRPGLGGQSQQGCCAEGGEPVLGPCCWELDLVLWLLRRTRPDSRHRLQVLAVLCEAREAAGSHRAGNVTSDMCLSNSPCQAECGDSFVTPPPAYPSARGHAGQPELCVWM